MFAAEARRMLHRRSTASAVAALVVLTGGALSSCGFDTPTDRVNTIAAGANEREASVDALGIRVLSSAKGEGRLIGSFTNNESEAASFTELSGEGVTVEEFEPIEVPANGRVNLSTAETAVHLTGDFVAGEVITLELSFDAAESETVTMDVPVVKNCHQYTAVPTPSAAEGSAASPSADEHGSESADEHASETAEGEHAESESAHAESESAHAESESAHAEGEHEDATYVCDHPTEGAGH